MELKINTKFTVGDVVFALRMDAFWKAKILDIEYKGQCNATYSIRYYCDLIHIYKDGTTRTTAWVAQNELFTEEEINDIISKLKEITF